MNRFYRLPLAAAVLAVVTLLLFLTGAPAHYEFSWPDAPRHALNGAFIYDLIRDLPFRDPVQWAYNYYAQYPALTILLYPPLYPAMLALSYLVFGVSQVSALAINALLYLLLGFGFFVACRRFVSFAGALAAAVLLLVSPDIAYWGRQTMTDVPAMAFMVCAATAFVVYLQDRRVGYLYAAGFLAVLGIWTKISVCFIVPVFAVVLILVDGKLVFRRVHYWIVAALVTIGVLPMIWLTIHFGQTNVESVQGVSDASVSRYSVANWTWYAASFPGQLGWPLTLAAVFGAVVGAVRLAANRRLPPRWLFVLCWFVVGYLFLSAIDLKHPRFSIVILPPVILAACWGVERVLAGRRLIVGSIFVALAAATLLVTVIYRPVQYVDGYAAVVKTIAGKAPYDSNVVFSGYRDGSFIFAMRAIGHRPDLYTIRADKLLLSVAIRRSLGVKQKDKSEAQIADELTRLKVSYVVAQPGFWDDLREMRRFQGVLDSAQFKIVARFPMRANYRAQEKMLVLYKNMAPLPAKRPNLSIALPSIGVTVKGQH